MFGPLSHRALRCARLGVFGALLLASTGAACTTTAHECHPLLPDAREPVPPPFTADQIRSALAAGRTDRYLYLQPEARLGPAGFMTVETIAAKDGPYTRWRLFDPIHVGFGEQINEATVRIRTPPPESWLDVMDLGRFDKATTRIAEIRCLTLVGLKDCIVYTSRSPKGTDDIVIRNAYAKDLPGPPVLHTIAMCKKLVEVIALLPTASDPAAGSTGSPPSVPDAIPRAAETAP
jgi:hypothetical protein